MPRGVVGAGLDPSVDTACSTASLYSPTGGLGAIQIWLSLFMTCLVYSSSFADMLTGNFQARQLPLTHGSVRGLAFEAHIAPRYWTRFL